MTTQPGDELIGNFDRAHQNSDADINVDSIHHTLGPGPQQAAPGAHSHIITDTVFTEEAASMNAATDLATPGPTIIVPVAQNGKIIVWASANFKTGSGSFPRFTSPYLILDVTGKNFGTYFGLFNRYVDSFASEDTVTAFWIIEDLIPGNTTIKLQYGHFNGLATVTWKNRFLAGAVCK